MSTLKNFTTDDFKFLHNALDDAIEIFGFTEYAFYFDGTEEEVYIIDGIENQSDVDRVHQLREILSNVNENTPNLITVDDYQYFIAVLTDYDESRGCFSDDKVEQERYRNECDYAENLLAFIQK